MMRKYCNVQLLFLKYFHMWLFEPSNMEISDFMAVEFSYGK